MDKNKAKKKIILIHILLFALAWFLYFGKIMQGRYSLLSCILVTTLYSTLYISIELVLHRRNTDGKSIFTNIVRAVTITDSIFLVTWILMYEEKHLFIAGALFVIQLAVSAGGYYFTRFQCIWKRSGESIRKHRVNKQIFLKK